MTSTFRPPHPVLRFCGVIGGVAADRDRAVVALADHWGDVIVRSDPIRFDDRGYYATTMGTDLRQELVAFDGLQDPAGLADWKHESIDWEQRLAGELDASVVRPINLDTGYLTEAKFVLATTKNRSHRVYLRRDVFAEITLTYVHGRWTTHDWTYPNYFDEKVTRFCEDTRSELRRRLRHGRDA